MSAKKTRDLKKARFDTGETSVKSSKKRRLDQLGVAAGVDLVVHSSEQLGANPFLTAPEEFVVILGSYERLLYGLSCRFVGNAKSASTEKKLPLYSLNIQPIFSFPAHLSSLRSVSASLAVSEGFSSERKVGGKYLASGGTDEVIKIWDLKRRKEVGTLEGTTKGTITCLRFVAQRNMLLAATSDCTIALYRVRDWTLLRNLKGHKGTVNCIDPHPSGRVALSVGQDKMLRMWDLVAGKCISTLRLSHEGDIVMWNSTGTKFAVICGNELTIYGIDMAIHHTLTATSRFHDLRFCYYPSEVENPSRKEHLFVACEDGKTRVFDLSKSYEGPGNPLPVSALLIGHRNRVKKIDLLEVGYPMSPDSSLFSSTIVIVSISSDGTVCLYDASALNNDAPDENSPIELSPLAIYDTDGSRLTCVCTIALDSGARISRKAVLKNSNEHEQTQDSEESGKSTTGEESENEVNRVTLSRGTRI